jgi:hypothetical protein
MSGPDPISLDKEHRLAAQYRTLYPHLAITPSGIDSKDMQHFPTHRVLTSPHTFSDEKKGFRPKF